MVRLVRLFLAAALVITGGCTPGAPAAPSSSLQAGATVIHIGLGKFGPTQTQYGVVADYSPNPLIVPRGTVIQFVNDDGFDHTASSLGQGGFPPVGPPASAQNRSGTDLAQAGWSSGNLAGGAVSQTFTASTTGTYFYGCFYHYGLSTPMRGVIVVQ